MPIMRCVSFCVAKNYRLAAIAAFFKTKAYNSRVFRRVLYIEYEGGDVFVFSYGCVVTWGLKKHNEQQLLKMLDNYAINLLPAAESDRFIVKYGTKTEMITHDRFNADLIIIETDSHFLKLAISHGLAQSIQLEAYEVAVQKTIEKNAHFPEQLAKKGIILSRQKTIFKRIGEIFIARNYINLNSEYLADPEFFWEYPSLEDYYTMSKKFLDIPQRVFALNQKLDILRELFEMLTSQLQHRHSSFLEWTIILLIFIEIIISIVTLH